MMTKTFLKFLALLTLCFGLVFSAHAEGTKIGHVSSEKIMAESKPAKAANAKIEKEFSTRSKNIRKMARDLKAKLAKLDKEMPVMSESERIKRQRELTALDQTFRREQRTFREDLSLRRNQELAKVVDLANKAISQVAKSERFDIILQDAIYVNPRVDITQKVLTVLNK